MNGKLTAKQVDDAVDRWCEFYEGGDVDAQAIADELNAALGGNPSAAIEHLRQTVRDAFGGESVSMLVEGNAIMRAIDEVEAATMGGSVNPDGLPVGLTISEDGNLLNWRGENYVRQSALGECELVYGENDYGDDGWWCQSCGGWFAASFRHTKRDNIIKPSYCQQCGLAVKR